MFNVIGLPAVRLLGDGLNPCVIFSSSFYFCPPLFVSCPLPLVLAPCPFPLSSCPLPPAPAYLYLYPCPPRPHRPPQIGINEGHCVMQRSYFTRQEARLVLARQLTRLVVYPPTYLFIFVSLFSVLPVKSLLYLCHLFFTSALLAR